MSQTPLTNDEVGRLIGLSHSGVSRIKSGVRHPGVKTMVRIEKAFGWSVQDQVNARTRGDYAYQFRRRIVGHGRPAS